MGWERVAGPMSRIVLVVIAEYALSVAVFFLAIRYFDPGPSRIASIAAAFFAALTLVNLLVARRVYPGRVAPETRRQLARLREDLRFLHWYVDDVMDRAGVGLLVLDPSLRVRSVNRSGLRFLSIEGKERLVGRSFRSEPMAGSTDSAAGGGEPLLRVLERCIREGEQASLRALSPRPGSPVRVDVDIHQWREPGGGARRLIVAMTAGTPASPPPAKPVPVRDRAHSTEALSDIDALRDYLRALSSSSRELGRATRSPETLLLEMQAKRALEILEAVERKVREGVS
ncbi:MAG: PAS domain-containing protein [Candidatus Eisenbacteria bacterium]